MTKHRVHLYYTMRAAFDDIEAESHEKAIDEALHRFQLDPERADRLYGEFADEITAALVDEENDPEYERSTVHDFAVAPLGDPAIISRMGLLDEPNDADYDDDGNLKAGVDHEEEGK